MPMHRNVVRGNIWATYGLGFFFEMSVLLHCLVLDLFKSQFLSHYENNNILTKREKIKTNKKLLFPGEETINSDLLIRVMKCLNNQNKLMY